ncbi:MAG: alpha/beta hydrolase [Pseudomonadota bacterium]
MTGLLKLLLLVVLGYSVLVAAVYLGQDRMIFMPTERHIATPEAAGLSYEDVYLEPEPGVRLHGWYLPGPGDDASVLLFLHGNAGNVSHRLRSLEQFHRLGLAVLIVDYRGYGYSTGEPGEAGLYADGDAAWAYLVNDRDYRPDEIVLFGRSLGAAVAARMAAERLPGAVILESAFTSGADLGAEVYPWLPVRWLLRHRFPIREQLPAISAPLLIAHSREDEIVPFRHAQRLREAAPDARLLEMRGGHNDAFLTTAEDYIAGLRAFLEDAGPGLTPAD